MRGRSTLLALLATGCVGDVGPCTPAPQWQLATPNLLAQQLLPAADGTLTVSTDGSLGGHAGPQLARISASGDVVASIPPLVQSPAQLAIDPTGAPVVSWCEVPGFGTLAAFDATLALQWKLTPAGCPLALARGPSSEVAFADNNGLLHLLDPTGAERWAVPSDAHGMLTFAPNGDVFAYFFRGITDARREHHAAATGALVDETIVPLGGAGTWALGHEGGFVVLDFDRLNAVGITRDDPTGTPLWSRPMHTLVSSPAIASNDDVLAISAIATQVVRLDGATGEPLATAAHCTSSARIVAATADSYLLYQQSPSGGGELTRYTGP